MRRRVVRIAAGLTLASATGVWARPAEIGPGPASISPEEAAIAPDSAAGLRDAVYLVLERDVRDHRGKPSLNTFRDLRVHVRAKVLSEDGRDVARLHVPYDADESGIVDWWGRLLTPDGRVVTLERSAMQVVSEAAAFRAFAAAIQMADGTALPFVRSEGTGNARQRSTTSQASSADGGSALPPR